jgi:arylsulfatase A-like enzyme
MRRPALTLALLLLAGCGRAPIESVLLLTMESVRAEQVSGAHYAWSVTDTTPPHFDAPPEPRWPADLDDLAKRGTRFASAFAPSGSALASLVSLHTGRPPEEAGVYSDRDRLEGLPTLAEALTLRGVRCGAFVGRRALLPPCGLERGFEVYRAFEHEAEAIAHAARWLEGVHLATPSRRLFVWIHFASPSPPFEPEFEDLRIVDPKTMGLEVKTEEEADVGSLASLEAMASDPSSVTENKRRRIEALHAAEIRGSARFAAAFLARTAELLGGLGATAIVFAGTNGEELGARGPFGSRRTLRDATLRVPLFLWTPPGVERPVVAAPVVELADLATTIARCLEVAPPEGSRGRDLREALHDARAFERVAYATWEDRIFTVRGLQERLTCNPLELVPGGWPAGPLACPREELHDVAHDPREETSLVGSEPDRLERMRKALARARAGVRARPPRPETDQQRLDALAAERIHNWDEHPTAPVPAATCGGRE